MEDPMEVYRQEYQELSDENSQMKQIDVEEYIQLRCMEYEPPEILSMIENNEIGDDDEDNSGTFGIPNRKIAYPFYFDARTKAGIYLKAHGRCVNCGQQLTFQKATIDHRTPLAKLFNAHAANLTELSRENRRADFFGTQLDLMCRACNSAKNSDGETYDVSKIQFIIEHHL